MQKTDTASAITLLSGKPAGQLDFSPRESAEIVVGFSGAIGCGMNFAVDAARRLLEEFGYAIVHAS